MVFDLDPRKQAMEVYFSQKLNQGIPLSHDFNDNTVQIVEEQNHLGVSLDKKKLDFSMHTEYKINKYNNVIGIMKRFCVKVC